MSRLIKLLCLLLCLFILAGCGIPEATQESTAATEVTEATEESTEPIQTEPPLVNEILTLAELGTTDFRIVYAYGASEEIQDAAAYLQREIQRLTGVELLVTEDMAYNAKLESYEILIGSTDREEDDYTYADLAYTGDYRICVQGRKFTIAANMTDGLIAAVMDLCDVLSEYAQDGALVIPEDFCLEGQQLDNVASRLPSFSGGSFLATCDAGNGTVLVVYRAKSEDCDAYLQKLESFGYTLHTSNEIDGNRYFTYHGNDTTVTVMDNPALGTVRITVDPAVYTLATEPESFEAVVTPSVTMLGLENYYVSGSLNQNGLSLIYQLSDGSFIVVDGGHNNSTAARQIYVKMAELAPDPQNIVIAAWIITHSHNDHAGAFMLFSQSYGAAMKLEKLLVNFPSDVQCRAGGTGTTYKTGVMNCSAFYQGVEIIKVHPGQIFYIRDAVIQILYTMDLYEPATLTDFNDSSIVCTVSLGGQKLMQTGDCGVVASGVLTSIYEDALKCDILQVSHHGYAGGTEGLYRMVDPVYVLWPSGSDTFSKYKDAANNYWLLNESNMRRLWVAEDDIHTLTLPIQDET